MIHVAKYPGYTVKYVNKFGSNMNFETNAFDASDAIKKLRKQRGGVDKIISTTKRSRLRS